MFLQYDSHDFLRSFSHYCQRKTYFGNKVNKHCTLLLLLYPGRGGAVLCCAVVWRWERLFVDLPGAVARLLLLRCGSAAAAAGIRAVIVHSLLLCSGYLLMTTDSQTAVSEDRGPCVATQPSPAVLRARVQLSRSCNTRQYLQYLILAAYCVLLWLDTRV